MRVKLWAWSMLVVAAPVAIWLGQVRGQTAGEVVYSNQRQLRIPVNIQENRRADLKEMLLFASWDQGRNWQQVAAIPVDRDAFSFSAPNDGLFWLRVAAINRQNKQEPENLYVGPPDSKIVIDTLKPLLRMRSLERQGDDVTIAWELQEENPDWTSFRVEYQEKGANALVWTSVSATAGLTGQARFRPTTSAALNVRVQLRDLAGNQSLVLGDLTGTTSLAAKPPAPLDFPGFSNKSSDPNVIPAAVGAMPTLPAPKDLVAKEAAFKHPPLPPPIAQSTDPQSKAMVAPSPPDKGLWAATPPLAPAVNPEDLKPVATSDQAPRIPPAGDPTKNILAQTVRKPLPPLQYVNNPEVALEYELSRVGPSGVGSVEIWWTQNDGQTWELYAIDDKIVGATSNGKHQRTLELPGDGVYGFVLVVKSRAGLGRSAPRAGDAPEMRVEVDTAPPVAQLFGPGPDPTRPNALILRWNAKDGNLNNTPITLEYAEKREGPWQQIAVNLPNTGKHSWQLPDRLPVQVYLRVRARDMAGNESVATTPDPQLVDLTEPEGRLINVTVSPRRP